MLLSFTFYGQKELKEAAMKHRPEERFEQELKKIKAAVYGKGDVKTFDKINRRIGRLAQKYLSAHKY